MNISEQLKALADHYRVQRETSEGPGDCLEQLKALADHYRKQREALLASKEEEE